MNDKQTARLERFSDNCPECAGFGTITRFYGGGVYSSTIDCDRCRGRGIIGNCTTCGGTGITLIEAEEQECPDCRGAGSIGDCPHCNGTGVSASGDDRECPHCSGFGFEA